MTAQADLSRPGLAIATRGLVHIYRSEGHDVAALSGIDLHVAPGEMIGLLGPSGAGKSTLLTLLGGLLPPSAGKIFLDDIELTALTSNELDLLRACEVSLMLQGAHRNLIPYLTPRQNLSFATQAARRLKVDNLPSIDAVLDVVDLTSHADEPLASLSPGQLQLVALAACIAVRPGVILADEPTSQLDHHARDTVLDALAHINADLGTTIVVVTHDPHVADRMPRTVTIRDGRIGGEGRAGEEFAVVTADGFLPLPAHALDALPPGTLLRVHEQNGTWTLLPEPSTPSPDPPEDPS